MGPRDHTIHLGHGESLVSSPQNHFLANVCFPGPQNHHKKVPGPKCQLGGPKIRSWPFKSTPGHEHTKDARRNSMQNPALEKANRAIWCKLWPKTISGRPSECCYFVATLLLFCAICCYFVLCVAACVLLLIFRAMVCYPLLFRDYSVLFV